MGSILLRGFAIAAGLVLMGGAAGAGAPDGPVRKAGWWALSLHAGEGGMTRSLHLCTEAASDGGASALGIALGQPDCDPPAIARTAAGWSFRSSCRIEAITVSTSGSAEGDFQASYAIDAVTRMTPAPVPEMAMTRMHIDARWEGACPAGRKPGDTVMDDAPAR